MAFVRSVQAAGLSIARHRGPSIVAIATLTFMLSALTIFILIADGMDNAASNLETKANLVADLNYNVSPQSGRGLAQALQNKWPQTEITYVSQAEAKAQFRKTFAGDSAMLSALQGNPLPANLEIKTKNPASLMSMARHLRTDARIKHLIFNPNLTEKLLIITTFVRIAGAILVLGLAFLALLIVVNTTHLTVEARREEIEVMKLIGANYSFVRNPLILEGVLLGLVGSVLATVVGVVFYLPVIKGILTGSGSAALSLLPISTSPGFMAFVAGTILLTGSAVGAAGSYISVRRFAHY